ncbi:MAG TPA: hypothetical protein VEL31_25890 [Ktedonobacteraceae bacterium]|nr:hypothetical protein [Ktedonobacteraceae bacterium]
MDNQQVSDGDLEALREDGKPVSRGRTTLPRRFVKMWIMLSGPGAQQFGLSIEEQERFSIACIPFSNGTIYCVILPSAVAPR